MLRTSGGTWRQQTILTLLPRRASSCCVRNTKKIRGAVGAELVATNHSIISVSTSFRPGCLQFPELSPNKCRYLSSSRSLLLWRPVVDILSVRTYFHNFYPRNRFFSRDCSQ